MKYKYSKTLLPHKGIFDQKTKCVLSLFQLEGSRTTTCSKIHSGLHHCLYHTNVPHSHRYPNRGSFRIQIPGRYFCQRTFSNLKPKFTISTPIFTYKRSSSTQIAAQTSENGNGAPNTTLDPNLHSTSTSSSPSPLTSVKATNRVQTTGSPTGSKKITLVYQETSAFPSIFKRTTLFDSIKPVDSQQTSHIRRGKTNDYSTGYKFLELEHQEADIDGATAKGDDTFSSNPRHTSPIIRARLVAVNTAPQPSSSQKDPHSNEHHLLDTQLNGLTYTGGSKIEKQFSLKTMYNILSAKLKSFVIAGFFPVNYPASVDASSYTKFTTWTFVHNVLGSAAGVFSMQSLLLAVGLGSSSIPLSASLNWVIKDGIGQFGGVFFAYIMGNKLDSETKLVRFWGSLTLQLSILLEMMTPCFPTLFILLGSIANIGKNMSWLAISATRATINKALCNADNMGDVTAKSGSQATAAGLIGTAIGIGLSYLLFFNQSDKSTDSTADSATNSINSSSEMIPGSFDTGSESLGENQRKNYQLLVFFIPISLMAIYANYKAVSAISLRSLNISRSKIVLQNCITVRQCDGPNGRGYKLGLATDHIHSPEFVAKLEPIVTLNGVRSKIFDATDSNGTDFNTSIVFRNKRTISYSVSNTHNRNAENNNPGHIQKVDLTFFPSVSSYLKTLQPNPQVRYPHVANEKVKGTASKKRPKDTDPVPQEDYIYFSNDYSYFFSFNTRAPTSSFQTESPKGNSSHFAAVNLWYSTTSTHIDQLKGFLHSHCLCLSLLYGIELEAVNEFVHNSWPIFEKQLQSVGWESPGKLSDLDSCSKLKVYH